MTRPTRLDTLAAILALHPAGLTTADLAARLGRRRTGNPATRAQVNDVVRRLRRERGLAIACVGRWPQQRYRIEAPPAPAPAGVRH